MIASFHPPHPIVLLLMIVCPATSSFAPGVVVPIPTFAFVVIVPFWLIWRSEFAAVAVPKWNPIVSDHPIPAEPWK